MNRVVGPNISIRFDVNTGPADAPTPYATSSPPAVCASLSGGAKSFVCAAHSEYTVEDRPP